MSVGSPAGQSPSNPPPLEIDSSELLARICYQGDLQNVAQNRLQPEGISKDDLLKRGFSLQRRSYLTYEILAALQEKRAAVGFFPMAPSPVLDIKDEQGLQALEFKFDSVDGINRAHTILMLKRHYSASRVRAIRKDLADCLGTLAEWSEIMIVGRAVVQSAQAGKSRKTFRDLLRSLWHSICDPWRD